MKAVPIFVGVLFGGISGLAFGGGFGAVAGAVVMGSAGFLGGVAAAIHDFSDRRMLIGASTGVVLGLTVGGGVDVVQGIGPMLFGLGAGSAIGIVTGAVVGTFIGGVTGEPAPTRQQAPSDQSIV